MTETSTGPRHGGALLTALLLEHDVEVVFGLPGGQTYALYDGIAARPDRIRHVLVRDERTGVYAADGYARVSGKVGVCDATVGPGTANLPAGLGEALGASIPLVALVSELPLRLELHRYRSAASQAMDQRALLAPVTKWTALVPDLTSMPGLVRQAFRMATTGRPGPVALMLPQDVLDALVPDELSGILDGTADLPAGSHPARFGRYPAVRSAPDASDVSLAAQVLSAAQRPVIVAGGGVLTADAGSALTSLAEQLTAAVATSLTGKGVIPEDHPLSVGIAGSMGSPSAAAALDAADTVLLLGTKTGSGPTYTWTKPRRDQVVIQLDVDPAELGRSFPLAAAMCGDARVGIEQLGAALADLPPVDRSAWRREIEQLRADWLAARDAERSSDAQPILPQRVVADLEAVFPDDAIIVCDASLSSGWAGVFFEQRTPGRRVLMPRGLAGLGFSLPAAIGAAVAAGGSRVIVLTGDGALGYSAGEFPTVTELGLPITVIVLNNRSLGWIRWYSRITFDRQWQDEDFSDVPYHLVAGAYGWQGERVSDTAGLRDALSRAVQGSGANLVDVLTETWTTPVTGHRAALARGTTTGYGG